MNGGRDTQKDAADDLPLGASVLISGTVIGRTEFQDGPPTYLVEFIRKGRAFRDWFLGDDLDIEEQDGGGI